MQFMLALTVLFWLISSSVFAATYYISPDASTGGDGSKQRPWTVDFGLSKGGGNEFILLPGIYRGPISLNQTHAGTVEHPTLVKSEMRWKAKIMGAEFNVINIGENTPHVIIDGLEIWGAGVSGIKSYSDNTTIRNCWIHNNSLMGIEIHGRQNAIIENNLVEYNGMDPQFHHGIYLDGKGHKISGNVVRHNAGFGLHLYPRISNTVITNNLIYGHASQAGAVLSCDPDSSQNRLLFVNNTVANNHIGLLLYGCQKTVIQNNIFANNGSIFSLNNSKDLQIDYNLYSAPAQVRGPHDIQGNPGFINPYKGIYWIGEKSPAIGHGNPGVAPVNDITGRDRPKNSNPDIGAYQYRKLRDSKNIIERYQYRTNNAADDENFIFWTDEVLYQKRVNLHPRIKDCCGGDWADLLWLMNGQDISVLYSAINTLLVNRIQ